jgi:hypothetical protein
MSEKVETKEEEFVPPSMEELEKTFYSVFKTAKQVIPNLTKKASNRILLKILGHPFESDSIKTATKDEEDVYGLGIDIQQIKTMMLLEGITKAHKQETESLVDKIKENPEEEIEKIKESVSATQVIPNLLDKEKGEG